MKKTTRSLIMSSVSLLLCFAMLIGTTFAWFTDSVTSSGNVISTGTLDIDMYWTKDLESNNWINAETSSEPVFNYDNWEPGYTEVRYVKIVNNGSLSLKYALSIIPEGVVGPLADVIDVYFVKDPTQNIRTRNDLAGMSSVGNLREAIAGAIPANGVLLAKNQTKAGFYSGEIVVAIALKMQENAGNEYQNLSIGDGFYLRLDATQYNFENDDIGDDFDANVVIPGPIVDSQGTVTVTPDAQGRVPAGGVVIDAGNGIVANVPEGVKMKDGVNSLTLSVANMDATQADILLGANDKQTSIDVHIEGIAFDNTVPMEVYISGAAAKGLNSSSINLYHVENGATAEMTFVAQGDAFTAHNQFKYDPATGDIVLYIASFSEIAMTTDIENKWNGARDYTWYDASKTELYIANAQQLAAFGAIVGNMAKTADGVEIEQDSFKNKTVKLVCDIYIGDITDEGDGSAFMFYPIGYYNNTGKYDKVSGNKGGENKDEAIVSGFYSFEGTFDGDGHVISDWYQNTWEAFGDYNSGYSGTPNHNRDGFGLFGRVYGATIKNLVINNFSSDGEYGTTGCVAAYADFGATFENISIFNSNPRVYNIGNGGVVGCVGWYTKGETDQPVTFRNITVDRTNKITALWGSWDVACGGIVGQYYPESGQSSANYPENAGILMVDCHVSAQIDVYNDVCANYQYYAYRYAGILLGSVRNNVTDQNGNEIPDMKGITFQNCTVNFGDWNDYYYCELVANSLASYTHDHQMSRLTQVASVDVKNKTVTDLNGVTTKIPESGRQNYVVVKAKDNENNWIHGDGHEYADCYHFVNGVQHFHDVADSDNPNVYETVGGVEGVLKEDKQCIYREFNNIVTGYGWGVTSKGITDFPESSGSVILDNATNSEEKFVGNNVQSEENNFSIRLGELFSAKNNLAVGIKSSTVHVTVMNVDDGGNYKPEGNVSYKFVADINDWTKGTLTFTGTGKVKVTIQDYYFCTPTTVTVEIIEATIEEDNFYDADEILAAAKNTGMYEDVSKSIGIDLNTSKVQDGYARLVNKGGNESYFYLFSGNEREIGQYFIIKYRIPELKDPNYTFDAFQLFASTKDQRAEEYNSYTSYNLKGDGQWRIDVIDLSAKANFAEYCQADNGRYYSNFLRVDVLNAIPDGQMIDIEYMATANTLEEIRSTINTMQTANGYDQSKILPSFSLKVNNDSTYIPIKDDFTVAQQNIIPAESVADNPYVSCIDWLNGMNSDKDHVRSGAYSISTSQISTINFNRSITDKLYINGWAVVDGGVSKYVWSVDDGKTWNVANGNPANLSANAQGNIAILDAANRHIYGNYQFDATDDIVQAGFQSTHKLSIDLSSYQGQTVNNIIFAAQTRDGKYCVLAVINGVEVKGADAINEVDIGRFIDSDSGFYRADNQYVAHIDSINDKEAGTIIDGEKENRSVSTTGVFRFGYSDKYGDIEYTGSYNSTSVVTVSGWAVVKGGVSKYVWSYDGKTWYDVKADSISNAEQNVINTANGKISNASFGDTDKTNGRFTMTLDLAQLIADNPHIKNHLASITIAAVPANAGKNANHQTELCVLFRLINFRVGIENECSGENHVYLDAEYALDENGYVVKVQNCLCGKESIPVESDYDPKYVIHFDKLGSVYDHAPNNTRLSNVDSVTVISTTYNGATELDASGYDTATGNRFSFIANQEGKIYISGWAGMDGGFGGMKYRVLDKDGNLLSDGWNDFVIGNNQNVSANGTTDIYGQVHYYYGIDDTGRRFGTVTSGTNENNVIDLSKYLVAADDSVTLELAFVSVDPEIMQTLGVTDALVYAGTFTNIKKVGCTPNATNAEDKHVELERYVVGEDGYIELQKYCMCGGTQVTTEKVDPKYVVNFDVLNTRFSNAENGTDGHNSVQEFDNSIGLTSDGKTNYLAVSSSGTKVTLQGWAGIEGKFCGLVYRIVYSDELGENKTDWISLEPKDEQDPNPSAPGVYERINDVYKINDPGRRFSKVIELADYLKTSADSVTIEIAFVYTPAFEELGNDALVYAGSLINVKLPAAQ